MAGMSDMPMRPARPGPPMQHRGPPPMARRPEPIDREKVSVPSLLLQMSLYYSGVVLVEAGGY